MMISFAINLMIMISFIEEEEIYMNKNDSTVNLFTNSIRDVYMIKLSVFSILLFYFIYY